MFVKEHMTTHDALMREKQIKRMKSLKYVEDLIRLSGHFRQFI